MLFPPVYKARHQSPFSFDPTKFDELWVFFLSLLLGRHFQEIVIAVLPLRAHHVEKFLKFALSGVTDYSGY